MTPEGCIRAEPPILGRILAQSPPGMIELGDGSLSVRLIPVCGARAAPHRRLLLVIDDLRARAQPGVLFDLRLGDGRAAAHGGGALVGSLNFFAAQRPGMDARPRRVSYDVTASLREMAEHGRRPGGLVLTMQPQHAPEPGAGAAVGRILLVEQ